MRRKPKDTGDPEWGLYCCTGCAQLLVLERVLSADIERDEGTATGYILFRHFCDCRPGAARVSRRWGSYPSFLALFGAMPPLPYQAPFDWQQVPEDEPSLARWRWELDHVADVDEFMLFANEAARRRAA